MGVIAERTEEIQLDRVTATSNAQRIVSTRADATHFVAGKDTVRIENCLFEHMLDDATNVHGAYVRVVAYLGATNRIIPSTKDSTFRAELLMQGVPKATIPVT